MKDVTFVEWLDHCSVSSTHWVSMQEIMDLTPVVAHTVGWVVKETDEYLVIVATLQHVEDGTDANDQDADGELLILKSCIKRREKLNLA